MTYNDIAAMINVAFGLVVIIVNLRAVLYYNVEHKWVYFIKAFAGMGAVIAFMSALLRLGKADEVPSYIGRPAFTICMLALMLGALVTSKDSTRNTKGKP
jgi:hypothetical protein